MHHALAPQKEHKDEVLLKTPSLSLTTVFENILVYHLLLQKSLNIFVTEQVWGKGMILCHLRPHTGIYVFVCCDKHTNCV